MFSGSFNGYITIKGEKYFSCIIRKVGDIFIGTAIPSKTLFSLRNNIATATALLSLFAFNVLLSFMLYSNSDEDEMIRQRLEEQDLMLSEEALAAGSANFDITMPDGKKKRVKAASARWSKRMVEWKKKSVEQKFSFIVGFLGLRFIPQPFFFSLDAQFRETGLRFPSVTAPSPRPASDSRFQGSRFSFF